MTNKLILEQHHILIIWRVFSVLQFCGFNIRECKDAQGIFENEDSKNTNHDYFNRFRIMQGAVPTSFGVCQLHLQ